MTPTEIRDDFVAQWKANELAIFKMIRSVCKSPVDAEDLFQRIFLEIFDAKRAWVPGTNIVNYIRFVVLRSIRSHERNSWEARNVQSENDEDAPTSKPDPEKSVIRKERWLEINDELPEFARLVWAETLRGNILPAEIAEALGVPVERVNKAKEKIKEVMEKVLRRHGITPPWLEEES